MIDTGVYGFVRHPMYLGADLMFVGGALLLGSVVGLLVGLGLVLLLSWRIFGEESCWPAILKVTKPIARGCATAWCRASGRDFHCQD